MALPLDDVITWLAANGIEGAQANWLPDSPDAVVVVAAGPGSPPTGDGAFESSLLHVRCRAKADSAAETLALSIHSLVCALDGSTQLGSTHVVSVESAAGPPMFLMRDDQQRSIYLASYRVKSPTSAAT